jgi:hypothetical protein
VHAKRKNVVNEKKNRSVKKKNKRNVKKLLTRKESKSKDEENNGKKRMTLQILQRSLTHASLCSITILKQFTMRIES